MENEYLTMREIGKSFGVTSHRVGKALKDLGYRNEKGQPSQRAFDEAFVAQRWAEDRPEIYLWAWHGRKTTDLLKSAGWKRPDDAGGAHRPAAERQ
jgi:hypothetical protein